MTAVAESVLESMVSRERERPRDVDKDAEIKTGRGVQVGPGRGGKRKGDRHTENDGEKSRGAGEVSGPPRLSP